MVQSSVMNRLNTEIKHFYDVLGAKISYGEIHEISVNVGNRLIYELMGIRRMGYDAITK